VQAASSLFADRKAAMQEKILAERDGLTKSFRGTFRARFERLRDILREAEEKAVHARMETDQESTVL
jgi:DNA polymerase II small subunit/DNA polymerase delta subunit B